MPVAADPSLRQGWVALSQVHLDQKRYREAAEAVDKAIALGAGDEPVLRLRWEAYRKEKAPQYDTLAAEAFR